jgi:hypothetical protein
MPDSDRKPDFFIVGAAKCGTTSLYEYLRSHPQLYMPDVKEPHFFGRDLDIVESRRVRNENEYLALFGRATQTQLVGESSVWYLYSRTAAREIMGFNPAAKAIIMLRHPADMMYSLHGHSLKHYDETIRDFEAALRAEPDRKQGRRIPRSLHFPMVLHYREVASFSQQVQRFLDSFGRNRVMVILFDDFISKTEAIYREVLEFLGVDPAHKPDFEVYNKNTGIRIKPDRQFLKTHQGLKRLIETTLPMAIRRATGRMIDSVIRPINRPSRIDPALRERLTREFEPEIVELGNLLNRDMSIWLETHE